MADHSRRILRNWQFKPNAGGNDPYHVVTTQSYANLFDVANIVGVVDKWAIYGVVSAFLVRPSTGAVGMRLPFALYRIPNGWGMGRLELAVGSISEQVGSQEQIANVRLSGDNFIIEARMVSTDAGTGIVNVTLDAMFAGGSGPASVADE